VSVRGQSVHIAQITDCHLSPARDAMLSGVNVLENLQRVLDVLRRDAQALDMLVLTGDLTHEGEEAAYRLLLEQFDHTKLPYYWLPGNHDHDAAMLRAGPAEHLRTKQVLLADWQILLLDSHVEDEVNGLVSQSEMTWLATALREHPDKYAAVFVHHHILPIGSAWLDAQRIANAAQLLALFDQTPQMRLVSNGHVHQEWSQQREHYWLLSTPSTCVQFKRNSEDYALEDLQPGCRRLTLHADGTFDTFVLRTSSDK
jgi:Icc protein